MWTLVQKACMRIAFGNMAQQHILRGLPETYTQPMMNAIVAFEMTLLEVQTKVKLNQHRPESHAAMHAAYDSGNESEKALAVWMRRLGLAHEP